MGYPPAQTWDGVPPTRTWDGVPPPPPHRLDGVPPPPNGGQSENITSRRTTYAGGNNIIPLRFVCKPVQEIYILVMRQLGRNVISSDVIWISLLDISTVSRDTQVQLVVFQPQAVSVGVSRATEAQT